ncbi:transcription intermediary factor 1-beta isoform X2 [Eleginops maclovinus]|uniref:transcription intermediary factor 1-beta isoform X2 n=1 Tax=Eleginops maclovinus TaxID=56733 RepID=UPI00307FD106
METAADLSQQCSSCESSSARCWCVDCNEALCDVCVSAHRRVSITRSHRLLNHPPAGAVCPPPTKFCRLHPSEPLKLFCFTCQQLTCRDCQLTLHMNHRYQFVSEALDSLKKQLKVRVKPIRAWGVRAGQSLQDMETRLRDMSHYQLNLQKELQQSYTFLIQTLKKRMDDLLRNAEEVLASEKQQIQRVMARLKDLQQIQQTLTEIAGKASSSSDVAALQTYSEQVELQLQGVSEQGFALPLNMSELQIVTSKTSLEAILNFGALKVSWVPFSVSQTSPQDPPPKVFQLSPVLKETAAGTKQLSPQSVFQVSCLSLPPAMCQLRMLLRKTPPVNHWPAQQKYSPTGEPSSTGEPSPSVVSSTPVEPSTPVEQRPSVVSSPPVEPSLPVEPSPPVVSSTPVEQSPSVLPGLPVEPSPPVEPSTPLEPSPSVVPGLPVEPSPPVVPCPPVEPSPVVRAVADSACDCSVQPLAERQEPAENEPTSTISEEPAGETSAPGEPDHEAAESSSVIGYPGCMLPLRPPAAGRHPPCFRPVLGDAEEEGDLRDMSEDTQCPAGVLRVSLFSPVQCPAGVPVQFPAGVPVQSCSVSCGCPCSVSCGCPCSVSCRCPCSVSCGCPCSVSCGCPCSVSCGCPCSVSYR